MSKPALSLGNYAAPMPWHHRVSFVASPEYNFIPGLVHATYLELLHQQRIVMLLGFAASKPNIEALDPDVFSFRLERIWCVSCFA